jgi:hypothetical protein
LDLMDETRPSPRGRAAVRGREPLRGLAKEMDSADGIAHSAVNAPTEGDTNMDRVPSKNYGTVPITHMTEGRHAA